MIHIQADAEALARAAAEWIGEAAREAVKARGRFRLGLSGGTTPRRLYRLLAGEPHRSGVEWARVWIGFSDERAVPPDHPDSNFRMARELLIGPLGLGANGVARMQGEAEDLDAAARAYEPLLHEPLDLLVLGVGPDGHTASMFPGAAAVRERTRRVVAVYDSPKWPPRRLTVTPRVLDEARSIAVLASGPDKASVVARALEGEVDALEVPARLVRERDWYLDLRAAERLSSRGSRTE